MEKINIAELLKDCPKGIEIDCTLYGNCTFEGIEDVGYINILVKTPNGQIKLSKEGCIVHNCDSAKKVTNMKAYFKKHTGKDCWYVTLIPTIDIFGFGNGAEIQLSWLCFSFGLEFK